MAQTKSALRFDHREIAVIFSLFVLVTLLMFTVGILVGKGITQAKFGINPEANAEHDSHAALEHERDPAAHSDHQAPKKHGDDHAKAPVEDEVLPDEYQLKETHKKEAQHKVHKKKEQKAGLILVPKKRPPADVYAGSFREPSLKHTRGSKGLLGNPKIARLLEGTKTRKIASASSRSFAKGKFTVQVGSYPKRQDAKDRVLQLQKLGFQHAFLSVKKIKSRNQTWYRVWLGYYPSFRTASKNADYLVKRGEVKNFLVRKTKDSKG